MSLTLGSLFCLPALALGLVLNLLATPHPGHTTGAEALWSGVPLLTSSTDEFSGRVGASLLLGGAPGGVPLVSRDLADYEAMAYALAKGRQKGRSGGLEEERRRLRKLVESGKMLCNEAWVRSWETALLRAVDVALGEWGAFHFTAGPELPLECPPRVEGSLL